MTIDSNVLDLAEAIAADVNTIVASIGDLGDLDTTAATSLVDAINEIFAGGGGGGGPVTANDITDATSVGKAVLTAVSQAAARTAIGAGTSSLVVGTGAGDAKAGNYQPAWSDVTAKPAVIGAGATMADARTAIGAVAATDVTAAVAAVVGGAGSAYDTLAEIQALLEANDGALSALTTSINQKVSYAASQSLTAPQQAQARSNIGAAAAADIGDPDTDYVAAYNAIRGL